ncbi:hypothetical protein CJU90_0438 [Yarrowia sp. C11]|nr:hypothetical protein CKK34_1850 [Yarrowia sp. E02]KAG5372785.1 hypothetical protein CJU90_0438 [Yarrowia sp. C11]
MGYSQRRGRKAWVEKTPQELVDGLEELKRDVKRSKFYDFFHTHLQQVVEKHSTQQFSDIQCLALGKPAEDEGVRYQLVLLLLLAEELKIPLDKVVCTEPMFTERDEEMLKLLGMKTVTGMWDPKAGEDVEEKEVGEEEDGKEEASKTTEGQETDTKNVKDEIDDLTKNLSEVKLQPKTKSFIYAPHAPVNVNELLFLNADLIVANYLGSYDTRFGDDEFKEKYPALSEILQSDKDGKCEWEMIEIPDKLSKGEAWAIAYNGFGIHRKKETNEEKKEENA